MAIDLSPFTHYASMPRQSSGYGDLISNLMQGYAAARMPAQMRQEEEQKQRMIEQIMLQNKKSGLEMQFLPKKLEDEQLKREMENQLAKLQLDATPEQIRLAQQLARLNVEGKKFDVEHQGDLLGLKRQVLEAQIAKAQKAQQDDALKNQRTDQIIKSAAWANMPSSAKENIIALGNTLGIRPDVVTKGMMEGKAFEDIAEEHGYNREEVADAIPSYFATQANITEENARQKNLAELRHIEHTVTDWLSPYVKQYGGMSLGAMTDALRGQNKDKLAKYYAALALQPELASLKVKVMGGNIGHETIKDIVKANFGKSIVFQNLVEPEVYEKMQKYMGDLLEDASGVATRQLYGKKKKTPVNLMNANEADEELARINAQLAEE